MEQGEVRSGRGQRRRIEELLEGAIEEMERPELLHLSAWGDRTQVTTLVLHTRSSWAGEEWSARLRATWVAERVLGWQRVRWEHHDGGWSLRRGRSVWLLCEHEVSRAVLDIHTRHTPEELCQIARYGTAWARACAGFRRGQRRKDGSIALGLLDESALLTEAWAGLSEAEREIVTGLAGSWEGGAAALCASSRQLSAESS